MCTIYIDIFNFPRVDLNTAIFLYSGEGLETDTSHTKHSNLSFCKISFIREPPLLGETSQNSDDHRTTNIINFMKLHEFLQIFAIQLIRLIELPTPTFIPSNSQYNEPSRSIVQQLCIEKPSTALNG